MQAVVTGGAGFIGSNLADALLADGHGVRVLDDMTAGNPANVPAAAELVVGDVSDRDVVRRAVTGADVVFHLAAHRAVLRSVDNPLATDNANTHGTLTVLVEAKDAGVRRVVAASSSSVYGGAQELPTPESAPLVPRSPYAVSKVAGELYCRVFHELYGLETVSLRYFNVYGPRQRPDSAYAAVIPLFIEALQMGKAPVVHGTGEQSRDFTFIEDVVAATMAAASSPADKSSGRAYNVGGGSQYSLLDLLEILRRITGCDVEAEHAGPRAGDVMHTSADLTAAKSDLGYSPRVQFEEGLRRTVEWFTNSHSRG